MGNEDDRRYSRAPRLNDLSRLCKYLNDEGVEYLLIGGFAMILHGYTRGTMDIDLLVNSAPSNIDRIKKALSNLPDNAVAEVANTDVMNYKIVRIGDEIVIDLMEKACNVTYEEAKCHIVARVINGVPVPFADETILMKMKQTVRPKDQQDISFLKFKVHNKDHI